MVAELGDCEVVGEAATGTETLAGVAAKRPDLVLLDIRMPEGDGITVARGLAQLDPPPAVIFVTALADRAFEALEAGAGAYLVKPVNRERLVAAIARAGRPSRAQLAALAASGGERTHLAVRIGRELRLVPIASIHYFRAEDKTVVARTTNGEVVVEESLATLERELEDGFVRVRRNLLVARAGVVRLVRVKGGAFIELSSGERLPVARRERRALAAALARKP